MSFRDWFNFGEKSRFLLTLDESPDVTFSVDNPISVDDYIRRVNANEKLAPRIGRLPALSIPAVLRGRNMITSIANLPLETYRGNNELVQNEFLRQINPYGVGNQVMLGETIEDLLFESISWWRITAYDWKGYPAYAEHLNVGSVTWNEPANATPTHLPSGFHPEAEIYVDGKKVADKNTLIRFDSPNPPLLKTVGRIIRRAITTMDTSEMYSRNPMPKLLFTPKADVDPTGGTGDTTEIRSEIQKFADSAADSPYNYVGAALDAKPLEFLSPADLQLAEIEKVINIGIANALGLDPEDLGVSTTSRTYQNAVDRRKDRINDLLSTYIRAIEERLSRGDVTPRGYFVRFNQDDYLKADPKTRMEVNTAYLTAGVMTVDEIRAKEGLAPLTSTQKREVTVTQKQVPTEDPNASQTVSAAADKMTLRLSSDSAEHFNFESEVDVAFAVDVERRTVKGLAVPFNADARSGGRRWRFLPGSLQYADLTRVKLLRDHDNSQVVGIASDLTETERGVEMTFKVVPGAKGDEVLELAKFGALDGLSIGVGFEQSDFYTDKNHPGVNIVRRAHLREVSLTAMPAFDDSRLTSVTASREGAPMECTRCGQPHDVSVCTAPDPEATFSIKDFQKYQQIQQMFGATVEAAKSPVQATPPASVQEDPTVPPREVPKTNTAVFVNEKPVYTFDSTSEYSFAQDIKAAVRGNDEAASKRLNAFLEAEFAVSTTNVSTLNPTVNRQDMYVDQLDYEYPIWNTINKGAPPNGVTPFQFPKWSSSSTLVADHTEGTEPSLGSMAVTNQQVTPTALSGKIEVNREAWDQMGSPNLDNLIRAEMRRAWFEGLETAAATFLDGLTLTEITLTTNAVDTALQGELIGSLIDLLFSRGGYRLREFMVQGNLYKQLALAKDGNGRLLFPPMNPQNAAGTLASFFANLNVNGLIGRPAWALGAISSASDNSYLFNRTDVHGWATAPQFLEFDIQVKSIYLGIWGYKAFANSRAAGIRRFKYDPVT